MGWLDEIRARLGHFKLPALVLLLGLLLLLLPGKGGAEAESTPCPSEERLEELLRHSAGVGEVEVLISESGVVVLCRGAQDPQVRLDIVRAVSSYTGFGSDKIAVLKMAEKR